MGSECGGRAVIGTAFLYICVMITELEYIERSICKQEKSIQDLEKRIPEVISETGKYMYTSGQAHKDKIAYMQNELNMLKENNEQLRPFRDELLILQAGI